MDSKSFHRREGQAVTQPAASDRALPLPSPAPALLQLQTGTKTSCSHLSSFPKGYKAESQTLHAPLPLISGQVSIFLAAVIIKNYILDWSPRTTIEKWSVLLRRGSTKRGQGAKSLPANGTWQKAPCLCLLCRSLIMPEDSHPPPVDKLFLMRNYLID